MDNKNLFYRNFFRVDDNIEIDSMIASMEEKTEIIVQYHGSLDDIASEMDVTVEYLNEQYAIITISPSDISILSDYPQIEYLELPKNVGFSQDIAMRVDTDACLEPLQNGYYFNLTGKGTIVGFLDSGIDYAHPDFINNDGTTRILSIWDQSIEGTPPKDFKVGRLITEDEINEALKNGVDLGHKDYKGHGTAVAGVACGNGRASDGQIKGVATDSKIIMVKLGEGGPDFSSKSTEIMRGVKFLYASAIEQNMPLVINISFGTNDSSHDGTTLFESYINSMAERYKMSIVVATGNEGNAGHHYTNFIKNNEVLDIEFKMARGLKDMLIFFWKEFVDEIEYELISPSGQSTGVLYTTSLENSFNLYNFNVYIFSSPPTPFNLNQEIFFKFISSQENKSDGIWTIRIYGRNIVNGKIDLWLPITEEVSVNTNFLKPSTTKTITTPATSNRVISVAAYDSNLDSIASFSGRGFSKGNVLKPDIAAAGVDVLTTAIGGGYDSFTGTSFAAPYVAGVCSILMEWGIVEKNDEYLYGERMKAFLQMGAIRKKGVEYPNIEWGYGRVCAKGAFDSLMEYKSVRSEAENQDERKLAYADVTILEIEEERSNYKDLIVELNSPVYKFITNNPSTEFGKVLSNDYAIVKISNKDYNDNYNLLRDHVLIEEPSFMGLVNMSGPE